MTTQNKVEILQIGENDELISFEQDLQYFIDDLYFADENDKTEFSIRENGKYYKIITQNYKEIERVEVDRETAERWALV